MPLLPNLIKVKRAVFIFLNACRKPAEEEGSCCCNPAAIVFIFPFSQQQIYSTGTKNEVPLTKQRPGFWRERSEKRRFGFLGSVIRCAQLVLKE